MKTLHIGFSVIISCIGLNMTSQQLNYSNSESYAIHDSINKSRWDMGGPLSHYTFRFMSEFFPVAMIEKPVTAFGFKERELKGIEQITINNCNEPIGFEAYLQQLHINGFIVVHKGTIVYERYLSMHPNELHTLQSVTKVVTSTLIAQLINEGKLNRDAP